MVGAADDLLPAGEVGGRGVYAQELQNKGIDSFGGEGEGDLVDAGDIAGGDDGVLLHVAEEGDLGAHLAGTARSLRQSRMSGWIPMESISLTECWVGLVLSSCAAAIQGMRVTWTKRVLSRPRSWRIWRMASRKGRDSMSPTVPPISTMRTSQSAATLRMAFLISLVTWGMTWTVLPR